MTATKRIAIAVALLLAGLGIQVHQNPETVSNAVATVSSWVGVKSAVVQAVIVEESSKRSLLPTSQVIAIAKAGSLGAKVIDPNTPVPAEWKPFVDATNGKPLPQLARKWSNGRITSVALPPDFDKLQGAVK